MSQMSCLSTGSDGMRGDRWEQWNWQYFASVTKNSTFIVKNKLFVSV